MQVKLSTWFEVKTQYDGSDGKRVKELYTVEALTFAEAEQKVEEVICDYNDYRVVAEVIAPYKEVVFREGEFWYRVKLEYIMIDEFSTKEKKLYQRVLVQANNIEDARKCIKYEFMKDSMLDYKIVKIEETKVVDVVIDERAEMA